jgi:phosphoribosylglycinamide formyltransferase-1
LSCIIKPSMKRLRLGVLGSGKGSNFAAIQRAIEAGALDAEVAIVISDVAGAGILELARGAGIPTATVAEARYRTRLSEENEWRVVELLREALVDLVVLAGYMRVVKAPLIEAFPRRIINIHPSLLPAFRGLEAWRQAIEAGVRTTGCTVHHVETGVDAGEIIAQVEVPVLEGDTPETLHARIQEAEHRIFPEVIRQFAGEHR